MNRTEFEEKSFNEVMFNLYENTNSITTIQELKNFCKREIDNGHYFLVLWIMQALTQSSEEFWWDYNYDMGALDIPSPVTGKADVEHFIED